MLNFSTYNVPLHTQAALEDYIEKGIPTGGFLYAVLSNNLVDAVCRADAQNLSCLKDIVQWLYNEAPHDCHGSEARVLRFMQDHPAKLKGLVPVE
jgi:hypothetical protein